MCRFILLGLLIRVIFRLWMCDGVCDCCDYFVDALWVVGGYVFFFGFGGVVAVFVFVGVYCELVVVEVDVDYGSVCDSVFCCDV